MLISTRAQPLKHRLNFNLPLLSPQVFQKPLMESELLTEKEVAMIFVNWKELIMCNVKLLKYAPPLSPAPVENLITLQPQLPLRCG